MRPLIYIAAALAVAACSAVTEKPPPDGRFYFPTGIAHVKSAADADGTLYVATSNFDKRYANGKVSSLKLSALPTLPPFGSPASDGGTAVIIDDLTPALVDEVQIQSFAGEMRSFVLPNGTPRLFVPARAERSLFHAIDTADGLMTCVPAAAGKDCIENALTLTEYDQNVVKPRAPEPVGVGLSTKGDVYVAHIQPADDPVGSGENFESYVVKLNANDMSNVTADNFISIGLGGATGSNSVAVGQRYAYVTGRFSAATLRMVDNTVANRVLVRSFEGSVFVTDSFDSLDTRGIALSSDERRVFIATRLPDSLVVLDVDNPTADFPTVRVVNAIPAPEGPAEVSVLERPGRGALVLFTCTAAGVLAIYDEDVGAIVAQVPGVGSQPYGLAVDRRDNGARVFITNFGDGSVAVVDIDNLSEPYLARFVARIGKLQTCLVRADDASCRAEVSQ